MWGCNQATNNGRIKDRDRGKQIWQILDVVNWLSEESGGRVVSSEISAVTGFPLNLVSAYLSQLVECGAVRRTEMDAIGYGKPGRKSHIYAAAPTKQLRRA